MVLWVHWYSPVFACVGLCSVADRDREASVASVAVWPLRQVMSGNLWSYRE